MAVFWAKTETPVNTDILDLLSAGEKLKNCNAPTKLCMWELNVNQNTANFTLPRNEGKIIPNKESIGNI